LALAKNKEQRFANISEFHARFSGKAQPSAGELAAAKATANHKSLPPQLAARPGTADMPGAPPAPAGPAPASPPVASPAPAPPAAAQMAPASPGYAPASYQPVGVPAHRPSGGGEGGGNKGAIIGVIGVVGVLSVVLIAWGAGAFGGSSSSGAPIPPPDFGGGA